jgi:hypothetical protein
MDKETGESVQMCFLTTHHTMPISKASIPLQRKNKASQDEIYYGLLFA